jgi:hypothetical protein
MLFAQAFDISADRIERATPQAIACARVGIGSERGNDLPTGNNIRLDTGPSEINFDRNLRFLHAWKSDG